MPVKTRRARAAEEESQAKIQKMTEEVQVRE